MTSLHFAAAGHIFKTFIFAVLGEFVVKLVHPYRFFFGSFKSMFNADALDTFRSHNSLLSRQNR